MSATLNLGTDGNWATKEGSLLAYNSENKNYKPLPFDFTRASSATVINKEGLIETVGSGEPRIDYKDDSKGALLLEPSRSNLVTYSQEVSNWSIISSGIVITDNTTDILSPSGKNDASKVEFNAASKILGQSPTLSGNYSGFIYVKGTQGETIRFNFGGTEENFTLTGGWDKLERTNITATANAFNLNTFVGVTARTIYLWGAQIEQGSYATSYIPTSGGIGTRVADFCTNGGNEQVFNSTEGVLYWECSALSDDVGTTRVFSISDGSSTNSLYTGYNSISNLVQSQLLVNGVAQTNMTHFVSDRTEFIKVAVLYKNNNHKMYVNGVEVRLDTSGSVPSANTFDRLNFDLGQGSFDFYGNVKDIRVYNTALTDQELIELTTI